MAEEYERMVRTRRDVRGSRERSGDARGGCHGEEGCPRRIIRKGEDVGEGCRGGVRCPRRMPRGGRDVGEGCRGEGGWLSGDVAGEGG